MARKICPVWIGYLLLNPFRKLLQNPDRILRPYLRAGMTAMDYGSAMGFFSIPMARAVGPGGRVVCVDIQEGMLTRLVKRAKRAKVLNIIEPFLLSSPDMNLEKFHNRIDFVLLFAAAHEVPDQGKLFGELHKVLKPGGRMLFSEPSGHLAKDEFESSVSLAEDCGFRQVESLRIRGGFSVLLERL